MSEKERTGAAGAASRCAALVLVLGCLAGIVGAPAAGAARAAGERENTSVRDPEGGAEGGDEVVGLLSPEDRELSRPAAAVPREPVGRLGLRGGLMLPGSTSEKSWDTTALFGLYYRPAQMLSPYAAWEVEFDYASVKRDDGFVTSRLYVLRGGLLFGNWEDDTRSATVFGVAGAEAVVGGSSWEASGSEESSAVGALEFGVGLAAPGGAWDVRAVYSVFLGSDNLKSGFMIAAGSSF